MTRTALLVEVSQAKRVWTGGARLLQLQPHQQYLFRLNKTRATLLLQQLPAGSRVQTVPLH